MTDETNTVIWEGVYKPFGEADVNPNSSVVSNFRFPGQYYDKETGLHYNYHRYYDPRTGRYLRADPIGLAGGINLYPYAEKNPVNLTDPLGLIVLYAGFNFGLGAGKDTKPIKNDNFNYYSGSIGRYAGTTRDKGSQEGIFGTGGAGRIMGLALGAGVLLGMNFKDVEDFCESQGSVGILLGPVSLELTVDKDGHISGMGFGFLGRGIGLGLFGLGTKTWLGSLNAHPPLEKNLCK